MNLPSEAGSNLRIDRSHDHTRRRYTDAAESSRDRRVWHADRRVDQPLSRLFPLPARIRLAASSGRPPLDVWPSPTDRIAP
jgi:hypothetical protein